MAVSIPAIVYSAIKTIAPTFPNTLPQEAVPIFPRIRYQLAARDTFPDICGSGDYDTDNATVEIECAARTHGAALAMRDQVIAALADPAIEVPCTRLYSHQTYDAETKTHSIAIGYEFSCSTVTP